MQVPSRISYQRPDKPKFDAFRGATAGGADLERLVAAWSIHKLTFWG